MNNLMNGLSTTLIGMLIVFFGLLVLIICISVMHKIMHPKTKASPAPAPQPEASAPVPAEPEPEEPVTDDQELIAVITAAIAAIWKEQKSDGAFVVRRVRRISNSPLSARLARDEQMYSHF